MRPSMAKRPKTADKDKNSPSGGSRRSFRSLSHAILPTKRLSRRSSRQFSNAFFPVNNEADRELRSKWKSLVSKLSSPISVQTRSTSSKTWKAHTLTLKNNKELQVGNKIMALKELLYLQCSYHRIKTHNIHIKQILEEKRLRRRSLILSSAKRLMIVQFADTYQRDQYLMDLLSFLALCPDAKYRKMPQHADKLHSMFPIRGQYAVFTLVASEKPQILIFAPQSLLNPQDLASEDDAFSVDGDTETVALKQGSDSFVNTLTPPPPMLPQLSFLSMPIGGSDLLSSVPTDRSQSMRKTWSVCEELEHETFTIASWQDDGDKLHMSNPYKWENDELRSELERQQRMLKVEDQRNRELMELFTDLFCSQEDKEKFNLMTREEKYMFVRKVLHEHIERKRREGDGEQAERENIFQLATKWIERHFVGSLV